jgi:hypothetical protein
MNPTKILYIAGYGRSGSTILDTTLGNHPSILGAGELTWLFAYAREGKSCTCGNKLTDCQLWAPVIQYALTMANNLSLEAAAEVTRRCESYRCDFASRALYQKLWGAVFRRVRHQSGCEIVVDSSKSTRQTYHRMELLHEIPELQVNTLHLVRDLRAVMWSTRRGSNRRLEAGEHARVWGGGVRTLMSWLVANRNVERFQRRFSDAPFLRLRYEDLVAEPGPAFNQIGNQLGVDLNEVIEALQSGKELGAGHGVSGNRTRRSGQLTLRVDSEWQQQLPWIDRTLATFARRRLRNYRYA